MLRVTVRPRRDFGALARRWLAVPVLSSLALATLSATAPSHSHLATIPVAGGGWLDRMNSWRASTGVPVLTEDPTWSQGDYNHAVYMVKNDLVTHYEASNLPYYTVAGDTAAQNSNIYVSSSTATTDEQAIDWWMQAPFHALGMMDPRLAQTGFGSYREVKSGWQMGAAVDVLRGNPFSGGQYPVYFPGNGTTEPLTTYGGFESPDPLQACSGYSAPTGLPAFVQVGGNISTSVGVHTFTGNGTPLEHCVIDSSNPSFAYSLKSRGAVILIPRQPLQTGVTYVVALTVNGMPYTWSFNVGPLLPAIGVSAVAPNAGPSAGGTTVTITGSGFSSGTTAVKFGTTAAATFAVVNDTTITAVTPAHADATVDVTVTTSRGTSAISGRDEFTFGACTTALMSPIVASPQAPGTAVTFTAFATTCTVPEYKFWVQPPGSSWILQRDYGSSSWTWTTSGLLPGVYGVGVWARSIGSGAAYQAYWLGTYTLTTGTCTAASLSTATTSPQASGTSITYTASGCAGAQFRFWLLPPGGSWTMQRDYGSSSWTWNTTGLSSGNYRVGVWARQPGSTSSYDAYGFNTFVLGTGSCTSAGVSPDLAAPQAPGATINLTASSNSCSNPQYQFWLLPPGGSWTVMKSYSATATWSWNTSSYAPGTYQLGVWAKQSSSSASYDAYYITTYQLDVGPCSSASISANPGSPQVAGIPITLSASSTGCTAPRYELWELPPPGTAWSPVQAYGPGNTFTWNTTGLPAGPYRFGVWARQNGSPNHYDSYAIVTFWVGS